MVLHCEYSAEQDLKRNKATLHELFSVVTVKPNVFFFSCNFVAVPHNSELLIGNLHFSYV